MSTRQAHICIAGAGPAGVLLALLLARKGIRVTLLETHGDLDRDFRGDTVHASTLEVLDQIGLADSVLQLPHARMQQLTINTPGRSIELVNFQRLKTRFPFVAMMPQAKFLSCLVEAAGVNESFELRFHTTATGLLESGGRVVGVKAKQAGREVLIHADLVVACDGRFSKLRKAGGFSVEATSPPMDVAWIRLPRKPAEPADAGAFYIAGGRICVLLTRETEWQLGYVFPKGDFRAIRQAGITALQTSIAATVPWLADRVHEIRDFSQVHLLNVQADRLHTWHQPGLMLLGDAAHAMSPVGGVGINYAIGDAVAAANVLVPVVASGGGIEDSHLAEIQARREPAVRKIQRLQAFIQRRIVAQALGNRDFELPLPARLALATPWLRDIPARIIALGFSPLRVTLP